MFQKLKAAFQNRLKPVEPVQGRRILREASAFGDTIFTVKGTGYPGFFIIFGGMFLGIPAILLLAVLFGTPNPDNPSWVSFGVVLFLIPFFAIGVSTFATGIFLWMGKTRVTFASGIVTRERFLFGKGFQIEELNRTGVEVSFLKSHEENDQPKYKLTLESGERAFAIGGSLKPAELLWLEREFRRSLGREVSDGPVDIASALRGEMEADVDQTELNPEYQSQKLTFTKTMNGWEARFRHGAGHSIFLLAFGGIFLTAGLLMEGSLWKWLTENYEIFRNLEKPNTTSGSIPWFFPLIFGGVGVFVMLASLSTLGYRLTVARRHSRIHVSKHWFGVGTRNTFEIAKMARFEVKKSGTTNDEARFKLLLHLHDGKKIKLLGFASSADAGQLKAWLEAENGNLD